MFVWSENGMVIRSSGPESERTTNSTNSLAKNCARLGLPIFHPPSDFSVSAYQRLITRAPARASYPSCVTVYVAHPCSLRSVFQVLLPVRRSDGLAVASSLLSLLFAIWRLASVA
jgi:hypothetical protein